MSNVEMNAGSKLSVAERADQILDVLFGATRDELTESFSVFNSHGNNTGKIYLPLSVCLKGLVDANLPFRWDHDVREMKVVIFY